MLTERQKKILQLIITNYTNSKQPVGSKKLMEDGIKASSATIRNDMKWLEKNGWIVKTHSSSGRVPSIEGYRYYVDHLLNPIKANKKDVKKIRESFRKKFHEINDIIHQSAKVLSNLTSYTAFSLVNNIQDRKLTGFKIFPLNNRQVIAVIITDEGTFESQVFAIPQSMDSNDLQKIIQVINDHLVGESLFSLYHRLRMEIPKVLKEYFQVTEHVIKLCQGLLTHLFERKVFTAGQMNVLDYNPDLTLFKSMYYFMKDEDEINQLLLMDDDKIHIRIGSELGNELLKNMSMIQGNYQIEGHGKGTIALLGPTSMHYSKMFGLIDLFRQELTNILNEYCGNLKSFKNK